MSAATHSTFISCIIPMVGPHIPVAQDLDLLQLFLSHPIASPSEESGPGASLVVQWIRICLLMQETWVRSQAGEEPTCLGATKRHDH